MERHRLRHRRERLRRAHRVPARQEQFAPGALAFVDAAGRARIVADDLAFPNGLALTADGAVLDVVEADRGCFACVLGGADRRTLFVTAAEWSDPEAMGARTGQMLTVRAPAPGAGRP